MGCRGVLKMGEVAHAEKVGRSSTERLEPAARACDIYHSSPSLRRIKKMHLSALSGRVTSDFLMVLESGVVMVPGHRVDMSQILYHHQRITLLGNFIVEPLE